MSSLDFYLTLENKQALLRPLQATDQAALRAIALNEPELWQFTVSVIDSEQSLKEYIAKILHERDSGLCIPFVVFDKIKNKVAGCTQYMQIKMEHKRVEIGGTWIGKEFQGTGLNKAMKFLLLEYAFEQLDMNRVELKTNELNTPSRNAIASIGARHEGILRSHMINDNGTVRNTVYFSIIKEEWPAVKQNIFGRFADKWY